ncbi:hypothetical protein DFP73DRAFT_561044 [Morchella snyderi]|nr:hypothetical protein DFP73DRAFT_561044 [Morchella snyderi]
MACKVASPVVIESVAEVGGHSPDGFGGIAGAQAGGLVGEEGESESVDDSGLEEESGSDEEGESEGEEGEEGEFEEEDYSGDQGWWDDDGTYHGEEEGEYSLAGQNGYGEGDQDRMVWTCGICNVTVNIFAHDDHIASRPHIRAAKKQAGETAASLSAELAYVPIWRCTVCSEDMSVFLREEHIFGKEHLRMFRKQQPGEGVHLVAPDEPPAPDQQEDGGHPYVYDETFPDIPEPCFSSSEYMLRETFYCIICAAEFDLSMEEFHLDDVETWECTLCSKTVHPISKEVHLQSERHTIIASIEEAQLEDFHCDICRMFYSPIDEEKHLTGADHLQMVTRVELEQQYMRRMEDLRKKAESSRPPPAPALPSTADKGKGIQTGQDGEEESVAPSTQKGPINQNAPYSFYYCGDCRMSVGMAEKQSHLVSKRHQKKVAKIAKEKAKSAKARAAAGGAAGTGQPPTPKAPKKKAAPKQLCTVCNKQQKVVGMADHVNSKKHKRNLAAQQRAAGPSTQVAPPPPSTPMLPQSAPPGPPQPARLPLTQAALRLVPTQVAPRVVPQAVPRAIPNPVPRVVPRPAPATRPALNSPHVTIMGNKFHCKVCGRNRFVMGIEGHLKSRKHKNKLRVLGQ